VKFSHNSAPVPIIKRKVPQEKLSPSKLLNSQQATDLHVSWDTTFLAPIPVVKDKK
jgi:hypothetical protein